MSIEINELSNEWISTKLGSVLKLDILVNQWSAHWK